MTPILRRAGLMILSLLVAMLSIAGVAVAQEPSCYPVPPGGCDVVPTCEEIIAAIVADDVSLDQNGDGVIDAADLPADCGCDVLIAAIADGTLDIADLPEGALDSCGCDELQAALDAGTLDEADLPAGALDECGEEEVLDESDGPEEAVLADTGIDGGSLALLALAGLMGGMALVVAAGKRA